MGQMHKGVSPSEEILRRGQKEGIGWKRGGVKWVWFGMTCLPCLWSALELCEPFVSVFAFYVVRASVKCYSSFF